MPALRQTERRPVAGFGCPGCGWARSSIWTSRMISHRKPAGCRRSAGGFCHLNVTCPQPDCPGFMVDWFHEDVQTFPLSASPGNSRRTPRRRSGALRRLRCNAAPSVDGPRQISISAPGQEAIKTRSTSRSKRIAIGLGLVVSTSFQQSFVKVKGHNIVPSFIGNALLRHYGLSQMKTVFQPEIAG